MQPKTNENPMQFVEPVAQDRGMNLPRKEESVLPGECVSNACIEYFLAICAMLEFGDL